MMGIPICLFINPSVSSTQQSHGLLLVELHCCVLEHDHHPEFHTLLGWAPSKPLQSQNGWRCPLEIHFTLAKHPCLKQGLLMTMFSCFFSISKDGDSTSSLGDLGHCLATLSVSHTFPGVQRGPACVFPPGHFSWHMFNQNPQVPFWFLSGQPQRVLVPGAVPPWEQDFALPLADPQEVPSLLRNK